MPGRRRFTAVAPPGCGRSASPTTVAGSALPPRSASRCAIATEAEVQTVSTTREIRAPLESVWEIIKDPSRYGDWNVTHTAFPDGTPNFYAEGMTIRERLVIMGMPAEAKWTITLYEDLGGVVMVGDGPMGITLRQRLSLT